MILTVFTLFVGFYAFFGKSVNNKTRFQRLLSVVLLFIIVFLISQFKVIRLYVETRNEYIKNIEVFHQIESLPIAQEVPQKPGNSTFQQIKECVFDYTCYQWDGLIYEKGESYQENLARLEELAENIDKEGIQQTGGKLKKNGELYILIIGESSGRDTLHAYGGPVKNTPWLDMFKNREGVLFFNNAYAPHTYTVAALTHALTNGRMATGATFPRGQNIIGVSKANDFHTAWISNQRMVGPFSTPIGAIASTAHESIFTTGEHEGYNDDVPPDEAILPLIKDFMERHDFSRNTLLIIHLIGSHIPYETRYPKNFPMVDELDMEHMGRSFTIPSELEFFSTLATSQKYTDHILKEIFMLLEGYRSKPIVAAYFSDHGEDPFSYARHGVSGHDSKKTFNWSMSRIPFFMWVSPRFFHLHPDKLSVLKKHKDAPFTNDLIFDFYVGLSGIEANTYLPQFDIGSEEYTVNWENSFVVGKRFLAEDPAFIIKENIKNASQAGISLGIHYTNTFFKYRQAKNYSRNFEVDLMLRQNNKTSKNELMVGHDMSKHQTNMTFRQYLLETSDGFNFLWLDIKNLNEKTSKTILTQLLELDKEFGLKKRVLVESVSAESLSDFAKNGWTTSLYVKKESLIIPFEANDKEALTQTITRIRDDVKKYQIGGVSYHVSRIDASIQEQLKNALPANTAFYGWAAPEWSFSDPDLIDKISQYFYLKMLLLTFKSDFDI